MKQNKMREVEIEKIVVSCAGIGDKLEKSVKLLNLITKRKVKKTTSSKRIPAFEVRPGLETGCMVSIRKKTDIFPLLKRMIEAINHKVERKWIAENHFSFGVGEYIQIPEVEYQREIGMLGLDITIVFKRKGKRVKLRKIKKGRVPKKQNVSEEEILEFLKKNFNIEMEEENDSE